MRKEFLIAIISGVAIGVAIAFGIWRANSAFNSNETTTTNSPTSKTQNSTPNAETGQLTIAEPEENDVITKSSVKITGITKSNTTLVISGEEEDYVVKSESDGSFEQEVDLKAGVNEIILAHPANGDAAQTKSLILVYSSEFQKELTENE